MIGDWQTWAALGVVAIAAAALVRSALRRRGRHEGCGCPGAKVPRDLREVRKPTPR